MTDDQPTTPPTPPPPPPPPGTGPADGDGNDPEKRSWWKRSLPVWAVALITFFALVIGAAAATPTDEEEVATTDGEEVEDLKTKLAELEDDVAERDEAISSLESELEEAETTTTTEEPTTTTTTEPTTTTTTVPPEPVEVGRFSGGSTGTETADFTVDDTWDLQYDVAGGAGVIVEIIDSATGTRVDSIAPDPGSGTSTFRQGGTYYFKVDTYGADSWELVVIDQPG